VEAAAVLIKMVHLTDQVEVVAVEMVAITPEALLL
jgi:hypothetical protein